MNMYHKTLLFKFLPLITFALLSCSRPKHPITGGLQDNKPNESAVARWNGNKFSLFIHFGLYSLPGGVWNGQPVRKGYSEQIRAHGNINPDNYHKLARQFNPRQWNPDSVVAMAKAAGMRSIVITAKHHDGFALFETDGTAFNVVDATPYKRDIIGELSAACQRQGLNFGVYFSLIDWDFPGATPISDHNSDSIPPAHHQMNLEQVEELLTGYGPISEIWFDMGKPTAQQSRELAQLVRTLQPGCMISGRLWNDQGDFAVMGDNASPDFRMGTLWQTPASMFDETWGYRSWQVRKDSLTKANEKIRALARVVCNGGNYLLNIGPMGDGSIVPFEKEVLRFMGDWMKQNGEAVYNTSPLYLKSQPWGMATQSAGTINLFLLSPPANGKIIVSGLRNKINAARLLGDTIRFLAVKSSSEGPVIEMGKELVGDRRLRVIQLNIEGSPDYLPDLIIEQGEDDSWQLSSSNATRWHSYSGKDYYTTRPTVIKLEWSINVPAEGDHSVSFSFRKADTGKTIRVSGSGPGFEVLLSGQSDEAGDDAEVTFSPFMLKPGINRISVTLADQSNPHKEIGLEGLQISIRP